MAHLPTQVAYCASLELQKLLLKATSSEGMHWGGWPGSTGWRNLLRSGSVPPSLTMRTLRSCPASAPCPAFMPCLCPLPPRFSSQCRRTAFCTCSGGYHRCAAGRVHPSGLPLRAAPQGCPSGLPFRIALQGDPSGDPQSFHFWGLRVLEVEGGLGGVPGVPGGRNEGAGVQLTGFSQGLGRAGRAGRARKAQRGPRRGPLRGVQLIRFSRGFGDGWWLEGMPSGSHGEAQG